MRKITGIMIMMSLLFMQGCASTGTPPLQQTQVALYVQQTIVAADIATLTQVAANPLPTATTAPASLTATPTQNGLPSAAFEEWLSNARILLYEDSVGASRRTRWIPSALQGLDLNYTDTVDRLGTFQAQLSADQEWDLVIYARENRENEAGNLFAEIFAEYDQGASVIIEHWNLEDIADSSTALTAQMKACGFTVTGDWFDRNGYTKLLLYAHNTQNPVHSQPNSDIRLATYNSVRWLGDIGDLLAVTSAGEGQILYGTSETNSDTNGTVISCFGNRFILQTHATHQYERDLMVRLWENYIYNALYARYQFLN